MCDMPTEHQQSVDVLSITPDRGVCAYDADGHAHAGFLVVDDGGVVVFVPRIDPSDTD